VYDGDEDHQHYHDHLDVYDVYQHDHDRARHHLIQDEYSKKISFDIQINIPRNLVFLGFLFNRELRAEPRAAIFVLAE